MRDTLNKKITDRGVVYVGYSCNLDCKFCYYGLYRKKEHFNFEKIKRDIRTIYKKYNNRRIDITGGEPTIHSKIMEIVNYAKETGLEPRVITNGILLKERDFCEDLINAGIKEFLISLHGTPEIHNLMSGREGVFESLSLGIENINVLGIPFSSNTVITTHNYNVLPQVANLLLSFGSVACNFIMFNPFESWNDGDVNRIAVRNKRAAPFIKQALDICKRNSVKVAVRYLPFCALSEYERYICNFAQLSYDESEWDFKSWIRRANPETEKDYFNVSQMLNKEYYIETDNCKNCGVRLICGGIKKRLSSINVEDTKPRIMKIVEDPLYFKR